LVEEGQRSGLSTKKANEKSQGGQCLLHEGQHAIDRENGLSSAATEDKTYEKCQPGGTAVVHYMKPNNVLLCDAESTGRAAMV
jgi:hypothetical protein